MQIDAPKQPPAIERTTIHEDDHELIKTPWDASPYLPTRDEGYLSSPLKSICPCQRRTSHPLESNCGPRPHRSETQDWLGIGPSRRYNNSAYRINLPTEGHYARREGRKTETTSPKEERPMITVAESGQYEKGPRPRKKELVGKHHSKKDDRAKITEGRPR